MELDQIIEKLTNKMSSRRYQSSFGIVFDLKKCLYQANTEEQDSFVIGSEDFPEKFIIPDKNYGRDNEISLLLNNLDKFNI